MNKLVSFIIIIIKEISVLFDFPQLLLILGINLKAKFNRLPKWQKLQGAHTEIVVYEDENAEKRNKKANFLIFQSSN